MELVRFPSNGGFSVRRIFTFALAVIIAALLWVVFSSTPTYAAPEATWQGEDTLLFDNHGFVKAPDFKDPTNTIPADAIVYKSTVQPATEGSPDQKLLVLYFAPGVDPPTASTVQYIEFTYRNGQVSNPQGQLAVTVIPPDESGNSGSSCSVQGIGWIVCPVSNFLADAMDNIFNMLATFIAVKPMVLGDTSNSMYVAWNTMRTFANIVFVIAFLIIIYSQLTSLGISNYGLKKLIPRLVVAAVLVNLSYYITAIALDVSNVLGYSIQDMFNAIREQTFHLTNDDLSGANTSLTWATITGVALGAGGLIGGAYFLASGAIYLLIPVLIGLILTAILVLVVLAARQAIIVILVIIAPLAFVANLLPNTEKLFEKWKDLFITMLVFFPAFSLVFGGSQLAGQIIIQNAGDNIIMLIFGMAVQIAPLVITPLILKLSGSLLGRIAQLANNPNKGILDRSRNWAGKRAELRKNNTLRGFKPFEKMEKGDSRRAKIRKALSNTANAANRATAAPGRPFVRGLDNMGRNLDANLEASKTEATNRYEETNKKYGKINERKGAADLNKERIHNQHAEHIEHLKTTNGTSIHKAAMGAQLSKDALETRQQQTATYYDRQRSTNGTALNVRTVELENAKVNAELASSRTSTMISAYRAGSYETGGNERLTTLQRNMAENVIQASAWKLADQSNQYAQQRAVANRLHGPEADEALLNVAQGYGSTSERVISRERAQASAVATLSKLNRDARENAISLLETDAVDAGMAVKDYAIKNVFTTANSRDEATRHSVSPSRLEAALEIAAADGQITVFDNARKSEFIDQTIVDAVVARHVGDMKSKGGFHIQADPQLSLQRYMEAYTKGERSETTPDEVKAAFEIDLKRARLATLSNTNASNLGNVKFGAFASLADDMFSSDDQKNLLNAIPLNADGTPQNPDDAAMVQRIFESLRDGLKDPTIRGSMTDRLAFARQMEEGIRTKFFPTEEPLTLTDSERAKPGGGTRPASVADNPDLPTPPVNPIAGSPEDGGHDADSGNN